MSLEAWLWNQTNLDWNNGSVTHQLFHLQHITSSLAAPPRTCMKSSRYKLNLTLLTTSTVICLGPATIISSRGPGHRLLTRQPTSSLVPLQSIFHTVSRLLKLEIRSCHCPVQFLQWLPITLRKRAQRVTWVVQLVKLPTFLVFRLRVLLSGL